MYTFFGWFCLWLVCVDWFELISLPFHVVGAFQIRSCHFTQSIHPPTPNTRQRGKVNQERRVEQSREETNLDQGVEYHTMPSQLTGKDGSLEWGEMELTNREMQTKHTSKYHAYHIPIQRYGELVWDHAYGIHSIRPNWTLFLPSTGVQCSTTRDVCVTRGREEDIRIGSHRWFTKRDLNVLMSRRWSWFEYRHSLELQTHQWNIIFSPSVQEFGK